MADRQYELVYILPPDSTEQQVAEVQTQIEEVVSRLRGQIASTDNWGRKRLAYPIGRFRDGVYILSRFQLPPNAAAEIERALKLTESVIRHLLVRAEGLAPVAAAAARE